MLREALSRLILAAVLATLSGAGSAVAQPFSERGPAGAQKTQPIDPGVIDASRRVMAVQARAAGGHRREESTAARVRAAREALRRYVRVGERGEAQPELEAVVRETGRLRAFRAAGSRSARTESAASRLTELEARLTELERDATPEEQLDRARTLLFDLEAEALRRHFRMRIGRHEGFSIYSGSDRP